MFAVRHALADARHHAVGRLSAAGLFKMHEGASQRKMDDRRLI